MRETERERERGRVWARWCGAEDSNRAVPGWFGGGESGGVGGGGGREWWKRGLCKLGHSAEQHE